LKTRVWISSSPTGTIVLPHLGQWTEGKLSVPAA
jgi:hypothetical protein